MVVVTFILSIVSSLIIGFAFGVYCGYHSAKEEDNKEEKRTK